MPIEKILFPTKFRELSFNSLESLFVLRKAGLKEVILCHIIPRKDVGFVPYGGYLKEEEERMRQEARIRFEDWQRSLSKENIKSKIVIVVGEPVPYILHIANKEKVNLVVVGKKKTIESEGSFVGSHTLQIISRIKIPVLISKYMVQFKKDEEIFTKVNDRPFETPLLITDWSEQSKRAMEFLISLNKVVEKVLVFHNLEIKDKSKEEVTQIEKECKEKLQLYCEGLNSAGIKAEPHLGAGETIEEILRISRERNASMIISGARDGDRLHEMLHTTLSHRLAKMSELPVLLIP